MDLSRPQALRTSLSEGNRVTLGARRGGTRTVDQAISDCLAGSLLGGASGAGLLTTYFVWGGTSGAVSDSTPVAALYSVYVLSLGVAGGVGGILRPRLTTLKGQLVFCFVATLGLYGGQFFLATPEDFSFRAALVMAAIATVVWVVVGRAMGMFKDFAGDLPPNGSDS